MTTTNWATYPDDPGYSVSDHGEVRGPRGWTLTGDLVKGGYHRVNIRGSHMLVHRIVARTFIGPIPDGLEVNHKDGNKSNNRADNLEFVTPSENVRHSIAVLKTERAPGEANGHAKLTDALIVEIRHAWDAGETRASIALRFGIDKSHAWRIGTRRAWRHVA